MLSTQHGYVLNDVFYLFIFKTLFLNNDKTAVKKHDFFLINTPVKAIKLLTFGKLMFLKTSFKNSFVTNYFFQIKLNLQITIKNGPK